MPPDRPALDVAIVGAGAAGLATAIFARRANDGLTVALLDGARRPGAKILVSGGTRCNVTNRVVSERDFWGGRRPLVRRVLRAFTADDTVRFFRDLGVALHEEADGKLFPDSGRARDVLNALLRGADEAGVQLLADHRVTAVERTADGFRLTTPQGPLAARRVVLATGGLSLPKSGSDGKGLDFARRLGHTIVPTTPALDPLVLDDCAEPMHQALSGVSHQAELSIWIDNRVGIRLEGSLLWTHFGISGPAALNASRHWLRATLEQHVVRLTMSVLPGQSFDEVEAWVTAMAARRPKASVASALSERLPASVASALISRAGIDTATLLTQLTRESRRAVVHNLIDAPLPVTRSRGYNFAEATAGGVALDEVDVATMQSRVCPGLHLVGEMLDVDGRIGGFNFQWAWATGYVAGRGLAGTSRLRPR